MDTNPAVVAVALLVAAVVSCAVAHAAGRSRANAWAWGLVGPFGWIVAALHASTDSARESAQEFASRAEAIANAPAPAMTACACGAQLASWRSSTAGFCPRCNARHDGVTFTRPR